MISKYVHVPWFYAVENENTSQINTKAEPELGDGLWCASFSTSDEKSPRLFFTIFDIFLSFSQLQPIFNLDILSRKLLVFKLPEFRLLFSQ